MVSVLPFSALLAVLVWHRIYREVAYVDSTGFALEPSSRKQTPEEIITAGMYAERRSEPRSPNRISGNLAIR